MRCSTVLFDLDGTLIDSGRIILASFRHATKTVLGRDIPAPELLAAVGSSLHDQMRRFDEGRVEELVEVYREHNEPLHEELEMFAGIEDVLAEFWRQGRSLGIVTAKRRSTVELAFERLAIERFFHAVVTTESTRRHKPNPDPVLHALATLGTDSSDAAFVGDSPFDIEAGKAAGVLSIGVGWGGIHPSERLRAAEPHAFVETPAELLDVL